MTRMVGAARAWELAATGDPVAAEQALALGLVNKVVAAGDFEDEWKRFASELAMGPTRALALTKSLLETAETASLEFQLETEVQMQTEAGRTSDHLEGVLAFLAKRAPKFWGM